MKVKLLVPRIGPAGSFGVDDEIEVPEDEAKRMIAKGQASPVRSVKKEKATRTFKSEKAVK